MTRLLTQVDDALAAFPTDDKLAQLKLLLQEKLDLTLEQLDSGIMDLTPEDGLDGEIEQVDGYKDGVYRTPTLIDKALNSKPSPPTPAATATPTPTAPTVAPYLKGFRRLYVDVESHIRSLKSLGVVPDSYGSLLSPVLLNKLPPELRLVSRKVSNSTLDVDSLLKIVEEELLARE